MDGIAVHMWSRRAPSVTFSQCAADRQPPPEPCACTLRASQPLTLKRQGRWSAAQCAATAPTSNDRSRPAQTTYLRQRPPLTALPIVRIEGSFIAWPNCAVVMIKAAPLARRQRPGLCLGRSARAHAGPLTEGALIKEAHSALTRCTPRSSSLPIVQLAATASRPALRGRRMRSATPSLDPATTHQDLGACEEGREGSPGATLRRENIHLSREHPSARLTRLLASPAAR